MKPPQQEARLVDRLRDHATALAWLERSILADSDGDMEVWGARMAAVTAGLAVVRDAIAVLVALREEVDGLPRADTDGPYWFEIDKRDVLALIDAAVAVRVPQ